MSGTTTNAWTLPSMTMTTILVNIGLSWTYLIDALVSMEDCLIGVVSNDSYIELLEVPAEKYEDCGEVD